MASQSLGYKKEWVVHVVRSLPQSGILEASTNAANAANMDEYVRNTSPRIFLESYTKVEIRRSFQTTTVREQHPTSHRKGATDANATGGKGRVRTGDGRYTVLCLCQLGQDIPYYIDM